MENCSPGTPRAPDAISSSQASGKETLLAQLGEALVKMGWFASGSSGLAGMLAFLRQAPEDHLQGLIKGCQERIADRQAAESRPRDVA